MKTKDNNTIQNQIDLKNELKKFIDESVILSFEKIITDSEETIKVVLVKIKK